MSKDKVAREVKKPKQNKKTKTAHTGASTSELIKTTVKK